MTRRQITREERDNLMERSSYQWAAEQVRMAEASRRMVRQHLKAMYHRIGSPTDRRFYRRYMLSALADARVRTENARRAGWKIP